MDKQAEALSLVNKHVAVSAGVGLIPFPLIDMVALTGVQVNMLRTVAGVYGVPFSANLVKSLVSSLIGGVLPGKAAIGAGSLVKSIPVVGTYLGWAAMPALASALTFAIGRVFVQHFESGGTFLTFDPEGAQAKVQEAMDEAEAAAKQAADQETAESDAVDGDAEEIAKAS
jgi:uncharacterized protein (DUF697 family)